ncbi:MAG: lipoprotein signal peptidase [Flavobacteriales bacterium]|nr:lipoprotein signal peptidase [Flavobacteriales bacterium]MBT5750714.1 lipoprotein signal peptidase [Flavobacteriales bacterium]
MTLKKIFFTAFILVLLDQILKIWIKTHYVLGEESQIFDWFIIHFTENNGMAFGLEFGGYTGKKILTIFRIIVVGIGIKYIFNLTKAGFSNGTSIALGLIIGGAIGNIIDSSFYGIIFDESYNNVANFMPEGGGYSSLLHGKVVDMFYFPIMNSHFPSWLPIWGGEHFIFFRPVFNIADAGISIGIFMILLFYRKEFN